MMNQIRTTLLRSRHRIALLFLAFVGFWVPIYVYNTNQPPPSPTTAWYRNPAPCKLLDSALADLESLANSMHSVLNRFNVSHVLCYGTLWGALRQGRILSWDTNIDMCALDIYFSHVTTSQLQEALKKKGAVLEYDWRTGVYNVTSRGVTGYVHVFTKKWKDDDEVAMPGGWMNTFRRLFGQQQFFCPYWLLEAPFNDVKFHGHNFAVPHDGIELLKYQYPDDWWLEMKPPGCE